MQVGTLWLTVLFMATKVPWASMAAWTAPARPWATVKSGATSAGGRSVSVS